MKSKPLRCNPVTTEWMGDKRSKTSRLMDSKMKRMTITRMISMREQAATPHIRRSLTKKNRIWCRRKRKPSFQRLITLFVRIFTID